MHGGEILAERYAQGFTPSTPQLGWSMTKSVNSALIGILVKQGKLVTDDPAPVPEWQRSDDPRRAITLDQLLRMSSGLTFQETYEENPVSDVNVMLFASADSAASAAAKPLQAQPDTQWSYSSGTTNILSRMVRQTVAGSVVDYWLFPHRELFARLGTGAIFMEPDPSGTFVASSFMYATPRDWARLGQLYLQDGIWQGERILPEGWVEYSRTPTPLAPGGRYGAQFWLNQGEEKWLTDLPPDLFAMSGHDGQFVLILPSQDLVVVRLGYSPGIDRNELLAFVVDLLKLVPVMQGSER
jgi:CubicO group peptidase (beta-lactamase class C family)